MNVASIRFPPGAKSISLDMSPTEILKSLKRCCKFFAQIEQDQEEEKKIYHPFCLYLAESDLIHEVADGNAKIHLGCIFTDIFRLYAPDNPFPHDKTKDILLFIASQLTHLRNTKSAMFSKAFHILENIAAVKSFNICMEMDSKAMDEVYTELFKTLFSVVNSGHDVQLKSRMLDVMVCILTESETVPPKVFDIMLECLLEKCQKMNFSAYELAKELLRKTSRAVESSVLYFFQNSILGDQENASSLKKSWPHLLIELCKISSSFFLDAAPQLEMKLRTDSHAERLNIVRLIANLFTEHNSGLALQHSGLWDSFLARFNDIQSEIRKECVNFCSKMIVNDAPDNLTEKKHIKELMQQLKLRRHDTDEGVRSAVIIAVRHIAMQCPHLTTDELLVFLRERLLDKKHKVRETAIRAVADVNKKFSTSGCASVSMSELSLLQTHLLHVYYTHNFDDCVLIERIFVSSLVQYNLPADERMRRLLDTYCSVDSRAIKAISEMFKRQKSLRDAFRVVMSAADFQGNDRQKKLWPGIVAISSHTQSPLQGRDHIKKLVAMMSQDQSIRALLEYLVSGGYTCQKIAHSVRDLLKKLEQNGGSKQFRQAVQQLLERSVLVTILIDSKSLVYLERLVKDMPSGTWKIGQASHTDATKRGMDLLLLLSKHDPMLFAENECYEILLSLLKSKDDYTVEKTLAVFLSTSSVIEDRFRTVRTILLPELKAIASSSSPNLAKYAVRCISSFVSIREAPLMQVFHQSKQLASESVESSMKLQSLLTVIGCVAECLPALARREMKGFIGAVAVKQIIMKTNLKQAKKKDAKWCEVSEISGETATKLAAMKCIVRWLHGLKSNESDSCRSTLRLLQHMMHNGGDLMKCGRIPKAEMAHLRLGAALCVVKIARCSEYKELISTPLFSEIAGILMDEVREVRQCLLNKLYKSLMKFQVHISFMSLFWVISQEKLRDRREQGMNMYRQLVSRYRSIANEHSTHRIMPEYALSYTIHFIANDPDLPQYDDISRSVLSRMKDSLQFMLDPLLTRENPESFGFIKRLSELIKRTQLQGDARGEAGNRTLYTVCDLVLQNVLTKSAQYAVGIIEPPDEAIQKYLPPNLYTTPVTEENHQNYLPEAFQVEPKLIPVKTKAGSQASSGEQKTGLSTTKQRSKLPRKLVAVTKVAVAHSSDAGEKASASQETLSDLNQSQLCQKRRMSAERSSSDGKCLSVKRTKLQEAEMQNASFQSTSNFHCSAHSDSNSLNSRPKRAAAGSKMLHYLNSIKRSPVKKISDVSSKRNSVSRVASPRKHKSSKTGT